MNIRKLYTNNNLILLVFIIFIILFTFLISLIFTQSNNYNKHYKAVLLVIASNDDPNMVNLKDVWKQYMNLDPSVKVLFVYANKYIDLNDYDPNCDIVLKDVVENYPKQMVEKNVLAMEYINSNLSYDYLIRTNLSTFWNFKTLHMYLDKLPETNCYAGWTWYHEPVPFVSGTSIILSKDMVDLVVKNIELIKPYYNNIPDDVFFGVFFNQMNIKIISFGVIFYNNQVDFINIKDRDDAGIVFEVIDNIDKHVEEALLYSINNNFCFYRIRSSDRFKNDAILYNKLLKLIYDIE